MAKTIPATVAFEQGDIVRILPIVAERNPHNAGLVGQVHPVFMAVWHGGNAHPYQEVRLVVDGVEIGFHPGSVELA